MQRTPLLILLPLVFSLPSVLAQVAPAPTASAPGKIPEDQPDREYRTAKDVIDDVRFSVGSTTHYYNSVLPQSDSEIFFFPPVPPPLESEIPLLPSYATGVPASPELAAFVGDLFYPLLATRLAANDLTKEMRAELQAYRAAKLELQNELRSQIAALKETAPTRKEQEFAAFAALQAPRILDLETVAEKLRVDLRRTGLFDGRTEEKIGPGIEGPPPPPGHDATLPPMDPRRESKMIRGAAFFQEGLSPEQRRLLMETAGELETAANPNPVTSQPGPEGWLLSFSPATARIRLVSNLPAPLAKKISEYVAAKSALKAELRDALLNRATSSHRSRVAALQELAGTQAQRLAALELLAEEIRRALATLPNQPGPPVSPDLPPELLTRVFAYREHKLEVLKTLYAMLTASTKSTSPAVPDSPGLNALPWMRDGTSQTEVPPGKLRGSTEEFTRTQARLLGELNKEQAGIREAFAEYYRTANLPMDRKSINDLLKDFETSRQKQEIWDKYRDYQTAVLQPGLSPEQRRLLFAGAVEQLSLSLPAGEKIP